jgi:Fic family protein
MNINQFKAGEYKKQYNYNSFYPAFINTSWTWDESLITTLLEEARGLLGELEAYTQIVPNIDLFIEMHKVKEANTSSRIEGTKTNIDEVFLAKEDISPERRDDWQEVQNYIQAINYAIENLDKLPLSSRLLQDTHRILLSGVRGEHKNPGEFRKSQNWIGGSSITDAVFIPPYHTEVPELMSDLEKFIHNQDIHVPHLIKTAICHYQFETIHPFLDGNGRIGRMLITLYLINFGLLSKPSLYVSDFFEKNRSSYYDALSRVRETNDLAHWIKFFLNAIIATAKKGKSTFRNIFRLKENIDKKLMALGRRSHSAQKLVEFLYQKPIIEAKNAAKILNVTIASANKLIQELIQLKIFKEITGNKRNRLFMFNDYLQIFID